MLVLSHSKEMIESNIYTQFELLERSLCLAAREVSRKGQRMVLTSQYRCGSGSQAAPTGSLICSCSFCALGLVQMPEAVPARAAVEAKSCSQYPQHRVGDSKTQHR